MKHCLQQHLNTLLSLIETSDDFVGLATLDGQPIYLNTNGRKLVGLNIDDELLLLLDSIDYGNHKFNRRFFRKKMFNVNKLLSLYQK